VPSLQKLRPEKASKIGTERPPSQPDGPSPGRVSRWLLVASGAITLLGFTSKPPDTMLLIYTCFVLAYCFRKPLQRWVGSLPIGLPWLTLLSFWAAGSLTESLAWSNNYLKAAPEPALFHPQLIPDLIVGLGFYGGWAGAWWIATRWFRYSIRDAFLVTGFQGIFFEQLGAVFSAMLQLLSTNPGLALLFGVYVFLVHGSTVGLSLVPIHHRLMSPTASRSPLRFPVAIALMVGGAFLGAWCIAMGAELFGGLPEKRSIVEHPLW
jgi:hypothetical protein